MEVVGFYRPLSYRQSDTAPSPLSLMEYFLIDTPGDTYYPRPCGAVLINSPASSRKPITWLIGAWRAVQATNKSDLLFCYLDIQGIICWWISHLTLRKRNIIAINLLLKDKPTIKNRITTWIYRRALSSPHLHATVTSPAYGEWLNRKFNRNFSYYHLPDIYVYDDLTSLRIKSETSINTVFCGGRNGRDWHTMLEIACQMPDTAFTIVFPGQIWKSLNGKIPGNVRALHDIPYDNFIHEMASAQIVCLPLDTEAPAGLIVMFQAAALSKPIVTSNTVTTRSYITSDMTNATLVDGANTAKWISAIREMMNRSQSDINKTPLSENLSRRCNRNAYIRHLEKLASSFRP